MSALNDTLFPRQPDADELAFRLQSGFRTLLDALARPGELTDLAALAPDAIDEGRRIGLFAQTMALCDVLLDGQTTVAVAGERGSVVAHELSHRTHAHIRPLEEAAFCIIPVGTSDADTASAIAALSPGTLAAPDRGATCLVECATLIGPDRDGVRSGSSSGIGVPRAWRLSGPGIERSTRIACDRSVALDAVAARKDEFPCGIDLILVDAAGHVVGMPRSTQLVALDETEEVDAWVM
ncbi:MAG: phosphonate C-P lyase system protein PhnH [Eggerthellaceae bacterium]|jgi:alpha-D-ribose 1-methylphosphonate 5-triphosphate synthase subunit PhnH